MKEAEPRLDYKTITDELTLQLVTIAQNGHAARQQLGVTPREDDDVKLQIDVEKGMAAADALLSAHKGIITTLAHKYQVRFDLPRQDFEDLIQEGDIGFMKAIRTFDPKKNMKLSSWAFIHVRGQILRSLRKEVDEPPLASLDAPFSTEDERTLGDILKDPSAVDPEDEAYRAQLRIDVAEKIGTLPYREQQIVSALLGLSGKPMTLKEIGQQWGLSKERVRKIYNKTISQLPYRFRGYKDHVED